MHICLFALLCAHFDWLICCFVPLFWLLTLLLTYSKIVLIDFGCTLLTEESGGEIYFWGKKRFWSNLNISKQLFASGTMIYKLQNKREKSGTRSLEALKIWTTRQQKIQDRKDIEDIKDMKNSTGGTGKKRKQLELLGFIGTDKMARVDEDVNNRLFRREIRILILLL